MNSPKTSSGSASGSAARSKARPLSDAAIAVASAGAGKRSSKPSSLGHPLERVGEGVADRIASLGELALQLGVADADRPELIEEKRPVRGRPRGRRGTGRRPRCRHRPCPRRRRRPPRSQRRASRDLAVGDRQEELLLAVEVGVDGAGREPGLGRDLLDRRLVVAAAGEDPGGGRDQLLAGLRPGALCGSGLLGHIQIVYVIQIRNDYLKRGSDALRRNESCPVPNETDRVRADLRQAGAEVRPHAWRGSSALCSPGTRE